MFGGSELILIGVIVFLLFGSKKLPDIAKGFREMNRIKEDIKKDITENLTKDNDMLKDLNDLSKTLKK
jgi:Sec-independent protein translocase protein TatA